MRTLILLVSVFIICTLASFQNNHANTPIGIMQEDEVGHSIKAFSNPECSEGSAVAVRQSDGAIFPMSFRKDLGAFYTSASGLSPGTYTITVCCTSPSGPSYVGVGYVTLYSPPSHGVVTVTLTQGQCSPGGN